uniref:SCP domain-containing protein n=1 Tax=Mesocestoides corti TaxID=53468 RepID=A0A5K3G3S9_MESCO
MCEDVEIIRVIYLMALIWSVVADVPTEEERTQIVEFLTNLRESVKPPASNMMLMRYSSELEAAAQKYLASCSTTGPDRSSLPEDVFKLGSYSNLKEPTSINMLSFYASEGNSYNYDQNQCATSCLFYKMMILAASNAVGCGQINCTRQRDKSESYLIICLFKLNGGNADEQPYKRGESCSECPDGFACERKQCF